MIAIYARQSVDKKDSISIESQIDFCKREVFDEAYKVYTDRGFSGGNTKRPAFESMLKDIGVGSITKVVVYKLDRISRSIVDFSNIIQMFKKYNVEFLSSTEKFDTSTPMGNAMLNITMIFAQLERETIQKRIKDNYYARGKKGFYMGGRAPYGLKKVETRVNGLKTYTFEGHPLQLPFLIKMFDLYANTEMSLGKISDYLNCNEVAAAEGGLWDSCKISRILRSPVYVKADADVYLYYKERGCNISNDISEFSGTSGCYLYGRRQSGERRYKRVTDHVLSLGLHKGVIDSDIWLRCQDKLDSNRQIKNSGKGKHSWLSGYIKCGYCNYAVSVVSSGNYKYFNCRGKTNLKICKGHSTPIYVDKIEKIIERCILERSSELENSTFTIQNAVRPDTNKIKLQIIDIDNQIANLMNQLAVSNDVVMKYVNEKIMSLDNVKGKLNEELKRVTDSNSEVKPGDAVSKYMDSWKNLSIYEKKSVCGCFIKRILIKDDEIIIDWKL